MEEVVLIMALKARTGHSTTASIASKEEWERKLSTFFPPWSESIFV